MRILVITQYWFPENNIPQRRWNWLSTLMARDNHQVTVITSSSTTENAPEPARRLSILATTDNTTHLDKNPARTILRVKGREISSSIHGRLIEQSQIAISIVKSAFHHYHRDKTLKPDIIIGTVPTLPTLLSTYLTAKLIGRPYAIDLRDAWPELLNYSSKWARSDIPDGRIRRYATAIPTRAVSALIKFIINQVLRQASGVIVTSKYLEKSLLDSSLKNSHDIVLTTIRNVFPVESDQIERITPTSTENLNVLYAGTIGRAQKLSNAVRAASIANDMGIKVRLLFIGDGAERSHLEKLVKEFNVTVGFHEKKSANELASFYNWADTALVHLTDWAPLRRTVPSKTYELMSIGIHISGVVEGETAKLIEDLSAGHTVPPEDPIALALLWKRLSEDKKLLEVPSIAKQWVNSQKQINAPKKLKDFLDAIKVDNSQI